MAERWLRFSSDASRSLFVRDLDSTIGGHEPVVVAMDANGADGGGVCGPVS